MVLEDKLGLGAGRFDGVLLEARVEAIGVGVGREAREGGPEAGDAVGAPVLASKVW